MTYDEHVDCDRQLCEAEDKIIQLQAENERYKTAIKIAKTAVNFMCLCRAHVGYGWDSSVETFNTKTRAKGRKIRKKIEQVLSTGGGQITEGTSLEKSAHGGVPPSVKKGE